MKTEAGLCLVVLLSLLCSCQRPFDNPADEGGIAYQGFPSVHGCDAVVPVSPAQGGTLSWPTMVCCKCPDADTFQVQIALTAAGLEGTAAIQSADNTIKVDSAELSMAVTYYWRVRARERATGTWGAWSAAWSFTTASAITGVTPADGGTSATLSLDWADVTDASSYEVQVASSAAAVLTAHAVSETASAYVVTGKYNVGDVIYWRVRPVKSDGTKGFWSGVMSLTVDWNAQITGVMPADTGSTTDTTPLLNWDDVVNASTYDVQYATSASALSSSTAHQVTTSEYAITEILPYGTTVYWHIRPISSSGIVAAWNITWSFTVSWAPTYSGVTPADAGTTIDTTPFLNWDDVTGATAYDVEYATSAAGLAGASIQRVTVSEYVISSALANGAEIYWHVRPVNADGVVAGWSATWSFTVQIDTGITIVPDPQNPVTITFGGHPAILWPDTTMTVTATTTPSADSYQWYLNGVAISGATTASVTVGTGLTVGNYRLTLVVVKRATISSGYVDFTVAQSPIPMIFVHGGTYQMGSTSGGSDEQPLHSVTVSSFYIGKYEVTQAQYQQIVGSNPSMFTSGTDAPNRPVEQVSWYNAVAFCNALSDLGGRQHVYTINGTTVTADWTKNGFRLPTEAEWEFAAGGGTMSQGYTYSGSNDVNAVAWYISNSGSTTHAVGTKAANELGVFDMSGNVWEWVWDWYGSYGSGAQTDPRGPASGTYRVVHGGSWGYYAANTRAASRGGNTPGDASYYVGFRVCASTVP